MATGEPIPTDPLPEVSRAVDLGPIGPRQRYEFTPAQERIIADLAVKMGFVGAFLMAIAVLGIVGVSILYYRTHRFDGFTAVSALVYGFVGFWTSRASGAFGQVVTTVGWDVPHVMDALGSLRKMYALFYWLLMVAIVASLLLLVFPLFQS